MISSKIDITVILDSSDNTTGPVGGTAAISRRKIYKTQTWRQEFTLKE